MLILLVNLERRPDRLEFMTAQLSTLGLPFERIDAIDGLAGDFGPDIPSITGIERACALSHRKAWQHFLASGQERCLILEDDVILSPRLKSFLDDHSSNIPDSIELLRLETRLMPSRLGRPMRCRTRGLEIHRMYSTHYGCGAYVVSRSFAEAAVRDLTNFDEPVDCMIFGAGETFFYPAAAYQLRPALGIQAELFDATKASAVAISDLQPARATRFPAAVAISLSPKPSIFIRGVRKLGRAPRRIKAIGTEFYEAFFARSVEQDVPFAGPTLPIVAASLSVHRSEQAMQSALPAL